MPPSTPAATAPRRGTISRPTGLLAVCSTRVPLSPYQVASPSVRSQEIFVDSIQSLVQAIEARDPYTRNHSENVTAYALGLARRLGLGTDQVAVVRRAAMVHDIGKIAVPDSILRKRGALDDHERRIMQGHVLAVADLLETPAVSVPG